MVKRLKNKQQNQPTAYMKLTSEQRAFLQSFREANGIASGACDASKVPFSTVERWLRDDVAFRFEHARETQAAHDKLLHIAEKVLFDAVRKRKQWAIRFVLQTRGRGVLSEIIAGHNPHTQA